MKRTIVLLATIAIGLSLTSCGLFTSSCGSLRNDVSHKEMYGELVYREYELQRFRYLKDSGTPIRLSEITVVLLNNYLEVHRLMLKKPECLVKPELEKILKDGIPSILDWIQAAKVSDAAALEIMLGEKGQSYLSFIAWIK